MTSERISTALLVVGYPLAVGAALRLVPVWRGRRLRRFLVFEVGTASVTTGLLLRGRNREAALNATVLAGFALAWVISSRRR